MKLKRLCVYPVVALACWTAVPAPSPGASDSPAITRQQPAQAAYGGFRFASFDAAGRPTRWPSCAPIELLVNLAGAPPRALTDLRAAARAVGRSSRLRVSLVGTTDARPHGRGWPVDTPRGARGWPMVLVAWADPGTAGLDDDGSSGSASTVRVLAPSGQSVLVAGQVVLNRHHSHLYRGRLGQALLEHELGHLLGLAHVDDPSQVMYPLLGDVDRLASGDRAGLRAAGRGGCPAATPP